MRPRKYEEYKELMKKVYPNSLRRFEAGLDPVEILVDSPSTWKTMDTYSQNKLIEHLQESIKAGKRSFRDTKGGGYDVQKG